MIIMTVVEKTVINKTAQNTCKATDTLVRILQGGRLLGSGLCLSMLMALPAQAQTSSSSEDVCAGEMITQASMTRCAYQLYDEQEVKLNAAYQALYTTLDTADKKLLQDAERTWIELRKKDCEFESKNYEGGSIYPLIKSHCLTEHAKQRTEQLEAWLDEHIK